jgi:hypothetical protein
MLDTVHSREDATTRAPIGLGNVARSLVALAILLAIFLSFEPFRDLADPTVTDLTTGNETLSSLCLIFLAFVAALLLAPHARLLMQAFKRVPISCCWFRFCCRWCCRSIPARRPGGWLWHPPRSCLPPCCRG